MPKQTELPGTERARITEIETAAEEYVKVRDRRMKLTEQEVTAKVNLLTVVKEHAKELAKNQDGELVYRYDDELVILKPGKENVKVKRAADPDEEESDD